MEKRFELREFDSENVVEVEALQLLEEAQLALVGGGIGETTL